MAAQPKVTTDAAPDLSLLQERYLDFLTDPSDRRTEEERAVELELDRVTLWRWRKTLAFQEALAARREEITREWRTPVRVALIRAALGGDVSAIKLLETIAGEVTERGEQVGAVQQASGPALAAAERAYREHLAQQRADVGQRSGAGAPPDGTEAVSPVRVPGSRLGGPLAATVGLEGPTNGHKPNGSH